MNRSPTWTSRAARAAAGLVTLAALSFASAPRDAAASTVDLDFHGCAFAEGLGNGECQHFLRNPAGATDDPCWCDKCRNGISGEHHDGHTIPPGWNPTLFETGGMECYLKRHSVAWGITCSECMQNDKPWPDGTGGAIGTVPGKDFGGLPARQTVLQRLGVERRDFRKPEEVIVAYNKHFYIVTDIEPLKVRTPGGSSRLATRHEWAHLMIERAEFARREWVRNFGEPMYRKPIALYYTESQRDLDKIGVDYFRNAGAKGLRGGGANLCDDMCLTAIAFSHDKYIDDEKLQVATRHMLSRNLLSIWATGQTRPKSLPAWLDEGLAHWLVKTRFPNEATYDIGEASDKGSGKPQWSGKDWDKDVPKIAQNPKLTVIEEFLGKLDIALLTEDDHKRAWSCCDLCLSEWREPFVKLARALRQEKDLREAFTKSLGCTPGEFDDRWKDRVLGRRRSIGPLPGDEEGDETPGVRDRKAIRTETNPPTLAAKVKALGEIRDKKTVPVIVDVIAQNSDLVRETAFVTLLKTKDKECLETIWSYGLGHPDGIVRAYTAKLCGRLKLEAALPKLEAQFEDKNWYARAEAAVACGLMKDAGAMAGMRKMVDSDPSEKARVGALDALAMFHEAASDAVPLVAKGLDSAQWQIRIASAKALGDIGSMEAVDPLVARMEKETGRVPDEIYEALKKISRDDLGRKPANWRKWWDEEKANTPNGLPKRPEPPDAPAKPKGPDPNDPHATHDAGTAQFFDVEIYSNRVAFVIDTTETMLTLFTPDRSGAQALAREYAGRNKLEICKEEIEQALAGLDPRAFFNIVAFGMQIHSFKQTPVPASPGNISAAGDYLRSLAGAGRTNYYGALKAALDIGAEPDTNPNFKATPDTITFLTDGLPNEGDIVDADTLVEWYTGLNRYARVKTHTITFGLVGVDVPLLKNLAVRNGGRFTLVPEAAGKGK